MRGNFMISTIHSQEAFTTNPYFKSLGKYDLFKTVERLEAIELNMGKNNGDKKKQKTPPQSNTPVSPATTGFAATPFSTPVVGTTPAVGTPPAPVTESAEETPITPTTVSRQSPLSEPMETQQQENVVETSRYFLLKFSTVTKPFRLPSHAEVALTGMEHFQQEGMKCIPIYTRSETCYKFELRQEVDKFGHTLEFPSITVPLLPWEKRASKATRRKGTLLTFKYAGTGDLERVPAMAFDAAMQHFKLSLIVTTKFQRIKDTNVLNGNRLCVVKRQIT